MTTSRYIQSIKLLVGYLVVDDHKRTQQGVSAILLSYIYYFLVVCVTTMFYCAFYSKGYMSTSY